MSIVIISGSDSLLYATARKKKKHHSHKCDYDNGKNLTSRRKTLKIGKKFLKLFHN